MTITVCCLSRPASCSPCERSQAKEDPCSELVFTHIATSNLYKTQISKLLHQTTPPSFSTSSILSSSLPLLLLQIDAGHCSGHHQSEQNRQPQLILTWGTPKSRTKGLSNLQCPARACCLLPSLPHHFTGLRVLTALW